MQLLDDPKVAVIGLGLIGGSIAQRLPRSLLVGVYDQDDQTCQQAQSKDLPVKTTIKNAVESAQVVLVATPLDQIESVFAELSNDPNLIVSDVGTTKRAVAQTNSSFKYVGAHPFGGTEQSGFLNSRADLLDSCRWALCLEPNTDPDAYLNVANLIINHLGGQVVPTTAAQHDLAVAATIGLPHLLAAALLSLRSNQLLSARSFADLTRVASSAPDLAAQICFSNRANLGDLIEELSSMLKGVNLDSEDDLSEFFSKAFKKKTDQSSNSSWEVLAEGSDLSQLVRRTCVINAIRQGNSGIEIDLQDYGT